MDIADLGFKVIGVIVLIVVLLFIVTWAGMIKCSAIPFWCDIYETVLGSPRVLIVQGDEGLGNPELLKEFLQDPQKVGVNAVDIANLSSVSLGNLKRYQLVIVEKAKKMDMDQLQMFMDYVQLNGGRLVWVGDAGTVRGDDELDDLIDVNSVSSLLDNPWARAVENDSDYSVVNFDEFLGLRYIGNYCKEFNCNEGDFGVGTMKPELTGDHPLIYGAHPALEYRINSERDFSLVKQFPNVSNSNIVMTLDFGAVKQGIANSFPRNVPLIATSGLGERVAYYAFPIENFCEDNNYPNACILLLKNMYYGMLGK